MASMAPHITGIITGLETPVSNYSVGVVDSFPNASRLRIVESAVADRQTQNILPLNSNSNITVTDGYLEFRIYGVEGAFLDLSSLAIELLLKFTDQAGANLGDNVHFSLANGLSNTIFKNVQIYIGEKLVESNPHYNYWSFIKMITTLQTSFIKRIGKMALLRCQHESSGIPDIVDAAYFTDRLIAEEREEINNIKINGVRLISPLFLDISSLDQYLLDGIDLRIKLELSPNSWFINAVQAVGQTIKVNIGEARLMVDRIIPHSSALLSLHQSLNSPGKMLESIFSKTLYRTTLLGPNQTQIMIDMPFGSVIPEKMYMFIVNMQSYNGRYNRNPLYLGDNGLGHVNITINGSSIYDIRCSFPNDCHKLYYRTLKSLGLTYDHLVHYDAFKNGCSLFAFNFKAETIPDILEIEKSGILRIDLNFETEVDSNRLIILFGETQGVVSIDSQRNVFCDVRG